MVESLSKDHDGTGGAPGDLGAFNRGVGMEEGYMRAVERRIDCCGRRNS